MSGGRMVLRFLPLLGWGMLVGVALVDAIILVKLALGLSAAL